MEFDEVIALIKEPDKLNDPREIDEILFWVDSWKTDKEEALHQLDYQVANRLLSLIETYKSVAKAKAYLEIEAVFREQKSTELKIKQLASLKANLKRRFEILTNKFR